jgi:hypothetical protein
VPCLIHQVTEAEAEALAQADNLRYTASSALQQHALAGEVADDLRRQLTTHLAVQTASSLLASGESVAAHVGLDLVRAHAARAAWLLEATELLTNNPVRHRFTRMLASVVEQVLDTVGPESRLVRAQIRAHFADNAASISVEDNTVAVGLTGADAACGLVEPAPLHRTVDGRQVDGSAITLEIAATPIVLPEAKASRFFDQTWTDRPGGWPALIGAWAARAAAEQRGGSASFRVDTHGSGFVKLVLPEIVRDPKDDPIGSQELNPSKSLTDSKFRTSQLISSKNSPISAAFSRGVTIAPPNGSSSHRVPSKRLGTARSAVSRRCIGSRQTTSPVKNRS